MIADEFRSGLVGAQISSHILIGLDDNVVDSLDLWLFCGAIGGVVHERGALDCFWRIIFVSAVFDYMLPCHVLSLLTPSQA